MHLPMGSSHFWHEKKYSSIRFLIDGLEAGKISIPVVPCKEMIE